MVFWSSNDYDEEREDVKKINFFGGHVPYQDKEIKI